MDSLEIKEKSSNESIPVLKHLRNNAYKLKLWPSSLMMSSPNNFHGWSGRGELVEEAMPRTHQEVNRPPKEVVGADAHLLKSYGERSFNLVIQVLHGKLNLWML